jgi:hypothetical protein
VSPMAEKRPWFIGKVSIQTQMLLIIVPLIVVPMLILAIVGFIAASGEAAKTSTRYLAQRENDLRTIAENLAIRDYYFNQVYGLTDEAEVYRRGLERSLKRFADRSNSVELIYTQVRYVDQRGGEVAKVLYPRRALLLAALDTSAPTASRSCRRRFSPLCEPWRRIRSICHRLARR